MDARGRRLRVPGDLTVDSDHLRFPGMGEPLSDEKLDELRYRRASAGGVNVVVNGDDLTRLLDDLGAERAGTENMRATIKRLTAERNQLQAALAGTLQTMEPGTSLEEQLHAVHDNLVAIRQLVIEERLRGCVLVWQEGKAVVIQVKAVSVAAAPAALIVTP